MDIRKLFFLSFLLTVFSTSMLIGQIDDIKKQSKENKENKNNLSDNSDDSDDNSGDGIAGACFSSCMDIGCQFMIGFIGEYTAHVYSLKPTDPTVLSFDVNANFAPAYYFANDQTYNYYVFLPGFRANLASFMLDFRFNMLTEFTDGQPNSFKSWDAIIAFNIIPNENFRISIGTGAQREMFSASYFHQYYISSKIGLASNRDYLYLDYRCSADYETGVLPFQEAGINYNLRFMDFDHIYAHLSIGLLYQNYYQSQDIWGIRAGIVLNWH